MRPRSSSSALVTAARRAGVVDERVLAALAAVPREPFLQVQDRARAGEDRPFPTSDGQTTSQPSLIATMLASLELDGTERVLDVGTGPGYQAALLAHLAREVHGLEVVPQLASLARENLTGLGLEVTVHVGDGWAGLPHLAPFDAIVVAAAAAEVPLELGAQLADGGRLLVPLGGVGGQELVLYRRDGDELREQRRLLPVRFVPFVRPP
ncbi:protein-L-isoaspartate O-methyltransferase [Nitriliruptoraceae bacterium ZYF776]|nr:protein-L-isoaspartate O-methyltransferase [Profundirhabdus halotolerans]